MPGEVPAALIGCRETVTNNVCGVQKDTGPVAHSHKHISPQGSHERQRHATISNRLLLLQRWALCAPLVPDLATRMLYTFILYQCY